MRSYLLYTPFRSHGFAKATAKQPTGLFGLLIPLLFLGIVRRFLAESYTDMSFALAYGLIDVNLLHTFGKYYDVKDSMRRTNASP